MWGLRRVSDLAFSPEGDFISKWPLNEVDLVSNKETDSAWKTSTQFIKFTVTCPLGYGHSRFEKSGGVFINHCSRLNEQEIIF